MRYIVATVFLTAILGEIADAGPASCSQSKDELAEQALDKVQGWESLFKAYLRYEDCDNGGTAERFSDLVVHLLATQWGKVNDLASLAAKDRGFRKFVLHHINATASDDELKKITVYANTQCPHDVKGLCSEIGTLSKAAAFESEKASQAGQSTRLQPALPRPVLRYGEGAQLCICIRESY